MSAFKFKELSKFASHLDRRSHEMRLYEFKSRKIKFTYQAYNAAEHFSAELFDGNKWNTLYGLFDCGITPNQTAYMLSPGTRADRTNSICNIAKELIERTL